MSQASEGEAQTFAALLAGGANRRYTGQPKALEAVGGELIAVRAIRALREAVDRVVLVANEFDTYRPLGLEMRSDLRPGLGALGGIHTAVCWAEEAGYPGVLVTACDMPFLSAKLLRELVRDAGSDEVVAPESGSRRGLEPLCAWYGSGCREAIENALDRGDRHVISFFEETAVRTLPLDMVTRFGDPELMFLNVNSPADRERAEQAVRSMEGGAR
ncbi:MAG: NTP transferase domain-containing protein [Gemmatimonadetes bacterium]|nr:NTP transferase domain-containing protein [Gemmatimonadota bacterium]NIO32240.1 NTP transferase domain-containing protein [Gemmatimonadota bacterium]